MESSKASAKKTTKNGYKMSLVYRQPKIAFYFYTKTTGACRSYYQKDLKNFVQIFRFSKPQIWFSIWSKNFSQNQFEIFFSIVSIYLIFLYIF